MGNETPIVVTPPAGQPSTPPTVTPPVADPANELKAQNDQLKKQLADKDRFITDLQSEKQTLEARFTQVNRQPAQDPADADLEQEAKQILEDAQVDPQKAGESLARVIKKASTKAQEETLRNLEPIIAQQTYANEIKAKNPDLIDLGLEPMITMRAGQLMQSGKAFKDAVDTAVNEARQKVDKLKSNTPAPPTPPPPAASGERGSNIEPTPPPPVKPETDEEELKAERERRRRMGL